MNDYADRGKLPAILYIADFPPSNLNGGAILLSRLFSVYPEGKITILTGSSYAKISPLEARLRCPHIVFPLTNNTGPWGIGRLKLILNYALIPFLIFTAACILFKKRATVIVTVAHGHFFLAATMLSILANIPLVLFVHDNWVQLQAKSSGLLKIVYNCIFGAVIRRSSHIFAISLGMQDFLRSNYNVESELQMPACEPIKLGINPRFSSDNLRFLYAGNFEGTVIYNFKILIQMFISEALRKDYGIESWRLCICTHAENDEIKKIIPSDPRIEIKNWLTQGGLSEELQKADILFLPFSFKDEYKNIVNTSLPTKLADYLASGSPILVFAPSYSSLARYAKTYRFAEMVEEASSEALAKGIYNIVSSKSYREELQKNAGRVFELNHNLIRQKESFGKNLSYLSGDTQIR